MRGGRRATASAHTAAVRVLALVPHYRCEEWLGDCLDALAAQTRAPDGIVVIDDGSAVPPVDIVKRFPDATLLAADRNVGPYALVQEVIERTDYDAYLFNDADDWSAPDRLGLLLEAAAATGAELIGSGEVRIDCTAADTLCVSYPLNVNDELRRRPCSFPLLHPTSLVSRALVQRTGGFATGMRFSGDLEFLYRAAHVGRVINVPDFCYFRRIRSGALTTAVDTGLGSLAREQVQRAIRQRAQENNRRVVAGIVPDLTPLATAPRPGLRYAAGPPLRGLDVPPAISARRSRTPRATRLVADPLSAGAGASAVLRSAAGREIPAALPCDVRPVFIVGAPRSGVRLLTWCLAQHPSLDKVDDSGRIGRLTESVFGLIKCRDVTETRMPAAQDIPLRPLADWIVRALWPPDRRTARSQRDQERSAAPTTLRWLDGSASSARHIYGLASLFPDARFIHIVRDAAECVDALVQQPNGEGTYDTESGAWSAWLTAVQMCTEAERAFGSAIVLRIEHAALIERPAMTLGECLAFLDEPYSLRCERPLRTLSSAPYVDPRRTGSRLRASPPARARALALSRELLASPLTRYEPDRASIERLRVTYLQQAAAAAAARETSAARLADLIKLSVPAGSTVLVVGRGDDELLTIDGLECWHFPRTGDGGYAGHHPADSAEAIEHLEALRSLGADHIVFPGTAFWWLDHYAAFRRHLTDRYCVQTYQDGQLLIVGLRDHARSVSRDLDLRLGIGAVAAGLNHD